MKIKSVVSLLALAVDIVIHIGVLFMVAIYVLVSKAIIGVLRLINKIFKLLGLKKPSSEPMA
ncbi:hypothetical protein [Francisella adeliensis]|uniref:Uncharacterized protein n=1 Tax=Francisella adeliensis TaxID=2007306 RepID=A0A2Z4XXD0_9GAMM|nr:hypothetical protein [Francisella adeliensis]AXA33380.1 hypothetical protein CDH04_02655 [Francisella adeliensis]MBK2085395.1 hypothetical protein [Francisella adeliensis]MBK2097125.1 hypothetical protein [Francisella adeliensis]QIW11608.1 hypothetical protein FZC43_02655 [Francisella adeliensis]QIW13483.1 hypothetical protein FZC44_02655 [Francisella adeliensis]